MQVEAPPAAGPSRLAGRQTSSRWWPWPGGGVGEIALARSTPWRPGLATGNQRAELAAPWKKQSVTAAPSARRTRSCSRAAWAARDRSPLRSAPKRLADAIDDSHPRKESPCASFSDDHLAVHRRPRRCLRFPAPARRRRPTCPSARPPHGQPAGCTLSAAVGDGDRHSTMLNRSRPSAPQVAPPASPPGPAPPPAPAARMTRSPPLTARCAPMVPPTTWPGGHRERDASTAPCPARPRARPRRGWRRSSPPWRRRRPRWRPRCSRVTKADDEEGAGAGAEEAVVDADAERDRRFVKLGLGAGRPALGGARAAQGDEGARSEQEREDHRLQHVGPHLEDQRAPRPPHPPSRRES